MSAHHRRFPPFVSAVLAIVAVGAFAANARAAVHVTAVNPPNGSVGIGTTTPIELTVDLALNPTTVTAQSIRVMGRDSGPVPGTLTLDAAGTKVTFTPTRPYFVGEMLTLMASSAVTSASGQVLKTGFYASWFVVSGVGSQQFVLTDTLDFRQPGENLIRLYGFSAIDVDGDGSPDMSGTDEVSADVRLRKNDGCGNFAPIIIDPLPSGQEPSPNDAADMNGDGKPDLVTGNQSGSAISVFRNNGAGAYLPPLVVPVGGPCHGIALLDCDSDGDIDVLASNLANVRIMKNNGSATLTNSGGVDGGGTGEYQLATADVNNDGHADCYVANEASGTVGVLLGDGMGGFALSATKSIGPEIWGLGAGDINGDGNIDAIGTDNLSGNAVVLRGNGTGGFLAGSATLTVGSNPVSVDLGDFDGDGDLDLAVANYGSADASVFWNQSGVFVAAATLPAQLAGSCTSPVDLDRDGDIDLVVTDELSDKAFVYSQTGPTPVGVQSLSCAAALRVDNFGLDAGFGGAAAHGLHLGDTTFLNLAGGANQPYLVLLGTGNAPGAPTGAGLLNLSIASPLLVIVSGFGGGVTTDGFGEALLAATIPIGAPTGIPITLQGAVGAPIGPGVPLGAVLTNPETVVLVP